MSKLKFIALSGTTGVTENLYVYETDTEMVVVDCGVGFPDLEMRGVDLVIPDFSYIVKNKHKLKGVAVSQGHEDHIGALPFLLRELTTQIWATPLVTAFLEDKFVDYKIKNAKINTFNPDNGSFDIGSFTFHPFRVTHSVPDSVGFAIDTPQGRVFHVPEHKVDQNPVGGRAFDRKKAEKLAKEREILFLASDCIGVNKPGYSENEKHIEDAMFNIVKDAKQAVFITAISSNIGRFQQAINVAQRAGRKVVYVGRSIEKKCELAHELGYLEYSKGVVIDRRAAADYEGKSLLYLVAGCYGQEGSSLYRLSLNEHRDFQVEKGDVLIFSADPAPPYTKESENFVIDNMTDLGVEVHCYDLPENLYVSGHGKREDIRDLFKIVRPKYFLPIGGTIWFMHSYRKLAVEFGAKESQVFTLKPGENVIFDNTQVSRGQKVAVRDVLVDGLGIGDVGRVVLEDRRNLSQSGVVVAIIRLGRDKRIGANPEIVSRGFVFEKQSKGLLSGVSSGLKKHLARNNTLKTGKLKEAAEDYLTNYFFQKTGRRPMILPVIVET